MVLIWELLGLLEAPEVADKGSKASQMNVEDGGNDSAVAGDHEFRNIGCLSYLDGKNVASFTSFLRLEASLIFQEQSQPPQGKCHL